MFSLPLLCPNSLYIGCTCKLEELTNYGSLYGFHEALSHLIFIFHRLTVAMESYFARVLLTCTIFGSPCFHIHTWSRWYLLSIYSFPCIVQFKHKYWSSCDLCLCQKKAFHDCLNICVVVCLHLKHMKLISISTLDDHNEPELLKGLVVLACTGVCHGATFPIVCSIL